MQDKSYLLSSRKSTEPAHRSLRNLPVQLTPLLGREQDEAAVCNLLCRQEIRLLTLTGAGGIGKTRLALQVATDLLDGFANGVYFVSLAPISDPKLVIPTIAQALDLNGVGEHSLSDLLQTFLSDKHLLLLLDNFEQVITASPLLANLLTNCPQLKLLITSRAVLHLQGEHEFPVPPLAVPDLKRLPDLETVEQYAAVALFLRRAQAVRPMFQLTKDNMRAVAEICVRLDGLPLALELAAARIKLFPPQALLKRLEQRLSVLTRGAQNVPLRQQTLRNTLQWSYRLLEASEQRLFRRLSVFVGGCTLEAIEAVCAALETSTPPVSVLDGVASLLDQSLLQQGEQGSKEPRLVILETIREYGLETLTASGEKEAVRQAHAQYYLTLAEEADGTLEGPQQAVWLEKLEQEHGNLRAALHWSLEHGEAGQGTGDGSEMALRFGVVLRRFWNIHGHWGEGRTFLERALAASVGTRSAMRAKALEAAASLAIYQGDMDCGEALCQESLVQSREYGDKAGTAYSLYLLSALAWMRGELATASFLLEESLALERELGDKSIAYTLSYLADLACYQGLFARAQALFEESLQIDRLLGNARSIAISLYGLARTLFVSQGDLVNVCSLIEEGLALSRELGDKGGIAHGLAVSGLVALQQGDASSAGQLVEESVALFKETEDPFSTAWSLAILARVESGQGDYTAAYAHYEESLATARKIGCKLHIPSILEGMASLLATLGEPARAARLWGMAEALREATGAPIWPVERPAYERTVAAVRALLGERVFAATWAEGRTMTPEQALAAKGQVRILAPTEMEPSSTPPTKSPTSFPAGLTAREVEVLRLVAQGLTDAQVAEQLVISPRTVNSHLTSIYGKIEVTSRSAATRFAIEHQFV